MKNLYGAVSQKLRIGSMKNEEDYLLLSQLTHAGYCLRRAALVMNEQLWNENTDTVKGKQDHQNVHDRRIERRREEIKLYEYDIVSHELRIRGKCDCIEAVHNNNGCIVPFADFPVALKPVEYKHGKIRDEEEYNIQLCAQAMCLEEMFCCSVKEGALYYGEPRRREIIKFTEELRSKVEKAFSEMHQLFKKGYTPKVTPKKACKSCSLNDKCLPKLMNIQSVEDYMRTFL